MIKPYKTDKTHHVGWPMPSLRFHRTFAPLPPSRRSGRRSHPKRADAAARIPWLSQSAVWRRRPVLRIHDLTWRFACGMIGETLKTREFLYHYWPIMTKYCSWRCWLRLRIIVLDILNVLHQIILILYESGERVLITKVQNSINISGGTNLKRSAMSNDLFLCRPFEWTQKCLVITSDLFQFTTKESDIDICL